MILKVKLSDLVNIANNTPIIGCRYIKTATSVELNLLSAYPFKEYVKIVVHTTTNTIGITACFNGKFIQSTETNWFIPSGKLKTKPTKNNHLKRVIKSYFSAMGLTIIR